MEPIELLIADDHPTFRRGLRALLRNEPSVAIVGEVETGDDAVAFAESKPRDRYSRRVRTCAS